MICDYYMVLKAWDNISTYYSRPVAFCLEKCELLIKMAIKLMFIDKTNQKKIQGDKLSYRINFSQLVSYFN